MTNVRRGEAPVESKPTPQSATPLRAGAIGPEVEAIQRQLEAVGFDVGTVDGQFGRKTTAAVKAFQAANDITPSGVMNKKTLATLAAAAKAAKGTKPKPTWSPERKPAEPAPTGSPFFQSKQDIKAAAKDVTGALAETVTSAKLTPLVAALGDGKANVTVPLKPGRYEMKGVGFTVRPGTTVTMQVEVKNGELVSAAGKKGTQLKISPALDLPLWVEGNGAKLVGDAANQKIQLELGGFFDLQFKSKKLSDLAEQGLSPDKGGSSSGPMSLVRSMVDTENLRVDAKVNLRERSVDLGGVKAKIDPDTTFTVTGTGKKLSVKGHVELDKVALDGHGLQLKASGGSADVEVSVARSKTAVDVDTALSNISMDIESLRSRQPSKAVPGKTNELTLGPTRIKSGELHLPKQVTLDGKPPKDTSVAFDFKAAGSLNADIHVKDLDGGAHFKASGQFDGGIALKDGDLKLDVAVKKAHLDLADLQRNIKGNQLSIERAVLDGDVKLSTDSATGKVQIDGNAKSLDVVINDFKGGPAQATTDLGRTTVTGAGRFSIGNGGFVTEGKLHGTATIDSAKVADSRGDAATVQKGSVIVGDITRLAVGDGPTELTMKGIDANLKLKKATLAVGDATVTGDATVKGTGSLTLDATGLDLRGAATVRMTLDDGRVHASNVALDLAKGSQAELNITDLRLGKTTKVELAPGSRIDALLDRGTVTVDGTAVELEKGSRAQFDVTKVNVTEGQPVDLRGKVTIDGKLRADQLHPGAIERAGVKIHPTNAQGRLKLEADDVRLSDGSLSFEGANVKLDAAIGHLLGARTPGSPGVGTLSANPDVLSADDVKATTPAALAGVPAETRPHTAPVDALRLLQSGDVKLQVPLSGGVHALGIEVLKFPPGTQLDLKLAVKDGKVVPTETAATLTGGVKAIGVEVRGVRATAEHGLVADLRVFGRDVSVPVPGVKLPADMNELADLAKPKAPRPPDAEPTGRLAGLKRMGNQVRKEVRERVDNLIANATAEATRALDLEHAKLDVKDATFGQGELVLPTGPMKLAPGSKLTFSGTPSAGTLTGTLALAEASVANDALALRGGAGQADLTVRYRREGNRAIAESELSNLNARADALVARQGDGDYVSLGQGQLTGVAVRARSTVALDDRGLPRTDVLPTVDGVTLDVTRFEGDVKSGRVTSRSEKAPGVVELGPTHLEGSLALGPDGLTLKGEATRLDGLVRGAKLVRDGVTVDVERARLEGGRGTVDLGAAHLRFDAKDLRYDVLFREVDAALEAAAVEAGQVRVTGSGTVSYDSATDLKIEGDLQVDGDVRRGSAKLDTPKPAARKVVVDRRRGLEVQ